MVNNCLNSIQHYLLPSTCIFCSHPGLKGKDICAVCYRHLPKNISACQQCAIPLPPGIGGQMRCGQCLVRPPVYDQVCAPYLYQGAIRHLLAQLKFSAEYKHARLAGELLAEAIPVKIMPDILLPMPLHNNRYRQRGFNQSIEIARTVSKRLRIPLGLKDCIRQRDTPHQTGLTAQARSQNIKNAFAVIKPLQGIKWPSSMMS